jgi:hypothetical protein
MILLVCGHAHEHDVPTVFPIFITGLQIQKVFAGESDPTIQII